MKSCFFLCCFACLEIFSVRHLSLVGLCDKQLEPFRVAYKKKLDIPVYNLYVKEIEYIFRELLKRDQSYDAFMKESLIKELKQNCDFLGINDLQSTRSCTDLNSIVDWPDEECAQKVLQRAYFIINICTKNLRTPKSYEFRKSNCAVSRQKKTYWDLCCLSRLAKYSDSIKKDVSTQFKRFLQNISRKTLSEDDLNWWCFILLNGFDSSDLFKSLYKVTGFDGSKFFGIWSTESFYTCENNTWQEILSFLSRLSSEQIEDFDLKEDWCDEDECCQFLFKKDEHEYVVLGLDDGRSAEFEITFDDLYDLGHPKTQLRKLLVQFQLLIRSLVSISEQAVKNYWKVYEENQAFQESINCFIKDNFNELFATYHACILQIQYYFQVNKSSTCCLGYSPIDLEDKVFLVCDDIAPKNIMLLFYELGQSVNSVDWDYLEDLTKNVIEFDELNNDLNIGLRDLFDLLQRCLLEQSVNELEPGFDEDDQPTDISAAEKQNQQKKKGIKNSKEQKIPCCISGSAIILGTFIELNADYKFFFAGELCFLLGKLEFGPKIAFSYKNRLVLDFATTCHKNCFVSVTGLIVNNIGFQVRYWLNEKKVTLSFSYQVESQSVFMSCVAGIMI